MAKFEIPVVLDSTFIKKAVRGVTASAEFNETTSDDYKKGFFDFAEALINTLEKISKSDIDEEAPCDRCKHFTKNSSQYPCSHCRNCYTNKFEFDADGKGD